MSETNSSKKPKIQLKSALPSKPTKEISCQESTIGQNLLSTYRKPSNRVKESSLSPPTNLVIMGSFSIDFFFILKKKKVAIKIDGPICFAFLKSIGDHMWVAKKINLTVN